MKNKYYYILLLVISTSCNTYEFRYSLKNDNKDFSISRILQSDEAMLTFTKDYDNSFVQITQGNSIIYDGYLTTLQGKARSFKINKAIVLLIKFKNRKILIKPVQMKDYRFVYIYKNKNKFFIEFNDGFKNLRNDNTFFPSNQIFSEKYFINKIDSSSNFYFIEILKKKKITQIEELIIVPRLDTFIYNKPKIKVGGTYNITLDNHYYIELTKQTEKDEESRDSLFYDKKFIWDRISDRKFYTSPDLINLYMVK